MLSGLAIWAQDVGFWGLGSVEDAGVVCQGCV